MTNTCPKKGSTTLSLMRFTKMHGLGNDYVYLDCWNDFPDTYLPDFARLVSKRHTGIGADGLILLCQPTPGTDADAQMIMFNADGSESEMCGNGLRCVAKLAYDNGHLPETALSQPVFFETGAGILSVQLKEGTTQERSVSVDMGQPRLDGEQIPTLIDATPPLQHNFTIAGESYPITAIGMGNPHAVCFVDDAETTAVQAAGSTIEHHELFPNRTNVEFVSRLPDENGIPCLRQRTWERGSGETQACGTGACATLVAAILTGYITQREAIIRLNGGDLHISWPDDFENIIMTGPATTIFTGNIS